VNFPDLLLNFGESLGRILNRMLDLAARLVSDYGKVLAQVQPGLHGMPESLLPHSKAQIRSAILMLLEHLQPEHTAVKEGLARGYVYLAQFVPDADAAVLNPGANANPNPSSEPAIRLMNRVKLDMERALEELNALGIYASVK
jgi:hypothetical protein